jgi:ubiquinone biosynthesis protein COQ4
MLFSAFTALPLTPKARFERFVALNDRLAERRGLIVPAIVDMGYLRSLPVGTFGQAWAEFLDHNHLQPLATGSRRKQLHDGIHVLTGYGSDLLGEAEVQAFLLGAKFGWVNLLLGLGFLRLLAQRSQPQDPAITPKLVWNHLLTAYQRGQRSHFDPDTWQPEPLWQLPLAEARSQLGIQ